MPAVRVQSHISGVRLEVALLISGALVIRPERQLGQVSTAACGTESLARGSRGPSTLLGPEGTAARRHPQQDRPPRSPTGGGTRDRPYLENCTVDASIICSCQVNKGTR
jgi:hypothetical protein